MKISNHNVDEKVFIVAEIGNNHEGDYSVAEKMLQAAAEAGADGVKFQTCIPELFVSPADPERMERMKRFQLSFDDFRRLADLARRLGVVFFSTPLDLESAKFLDGVQDVFKIASCDNSFIQLIDLLASFGKPMIISSGLSDVSLLKEVRSRVLSFAGESKEHEVLSFLHCVSSYPVPDDQVNLGAVSTLIKEFPNATIGYSDHSLGIDACVYAVAAGARIIEKHFTLDKQFSSFRDHQLSADPEEFKTLVERIRKLEKMMGSGVRAPQACEEGAPDMLRRSIALGRDMEAGEVLTESDIIWIRPGTGIPSGSEDMVLGKRIKTDLKKGTLLTPENMAV